ASAVMARSEVPPAVTAEIVPTSTPKPSQMIPAPMQREGRRHPFLDLLDDVRLVVVRHELSAEQLLHHGVPLLEKAEEAVVVESELLPDRFDVRIRRRPAGDARRRVAARDLEEDQ